uniref:Large ribosomal subunit protein bL21m n=1 Tax=Sus scrofa TaxID=9823 RepID=A0A8D1Y4X1_PIG
MAAAVAASVLQGTFGRLVSAYSRSVLRTSRPGTAPPWSAPRRLSSQHTSSLRGCVPKTSLGSPPWPDIVLPDPVEETRHHAEVVGQVNELIAAGRYGRLFAVVHFAGHQWKVTAEDLILIENELDVACGERIRLEKVRPGVLCVQPSAPLPGVLSGGLLKAWRARGGADRGAAAPRDPAAQGHSSPGPRVSLRGRVCLWAGPPSPRSVLPGRRLVSSW